MENCSCVDVPVSYYSKNLEYIYYPPKIHSFTSALRATDGPLLPVGCQVDAELNFANNRWNQVKSPPPARLEETGMIGCSSTLSFLSFVLNINSACFFAISVGVLAYHPSQILSAQPGTALSWSVRDVGIPQELGIACFEEFWGSLSWDALPTYILTFLNLFPFTHYPWESSFLRLLPLSTYQFCNSENFYLNSPWEGGMITVWWLDWLIEIFWPSSVNSVRLLTSWQDAIWMVVF